MRVLDAPEGGVDSLRSLGMARTGVVLVDRTEGRHRHPLGHAHCLAARRVSAHLQSTGRRCRAKRGTSGPVRIVRGGATMWYEAHARKCRAPSRVIDHRSAKCRANSLLPKQEPDASATGERPASRSQGDSRGFGARTPWCWHCRAVVYPWPSRSLGRFTHPSTSWWSGSSVCHSNPSWGWARSGKGTCGCSIRKPFDSPRSRPTRSRQSKHANAPSWNGGFACTGATVR